MCARPSEGCPDWSELQAAWLRPRAAAIAMSIGLGLGAASPARGDPCVPRLADVQAAAGRHLGLDERPRWRGRARWSALVPHLSLRARAGIGWQDGGETAALPVPIEVDHDRTAELRVAWRLDHIVYHPDEPRLLDAERRARRARATSDQEVTRLYFRWRRAATASAAARGDPDDEPALARDHTRALDEAEALANLDALTGGWLARRQEACR